MHIPPISIRPSGLLSIALKTLFPIRACHNKLVLSTCPRKPSSTPNAPAQQLQCLRSCSNDINTYVARAHFHTTFEPIHDLYSVPPQTNNVPRHLPHHPRKKGTKKHTSPRSALATPIKKAWVGYIQKNLNNPMGCHMKIFRIFCYTRS